MKVKDICYLRQKLLDIAKYHGANKEDSEDVVQDLYIKLLEIESQEGNLDRITYKEKINMVYLFNSIRNMINNKRRRSNRYSDGEVPELETPADDMTCADIESILLKMDDRRYYHKLYKAYFEDTISMRKLAKNSDLSLSTIFHGVRHIRKTLKKNINEDSQSNDTTTES